MDFFEIKKLIGVLLMPLPIISVGLILSIVLLIFNRQKAAMFFLFFSTLLLLLVSLPTIPNKLLRDLETHYPQFDMSEPVQFIVVLGCRHTNDRQLPITSQLAPCSIIRATEALRILNHNPAARIITSGSVGPEPFSNAYMTKQFLIEMGVAPEKITALEKSKDTEEEAINLTPMISSGKIALVTSASHMKRSMALFEEQGLSPIAAPTHHLVRQSAAEAEGIYHPSPVNIERFERWWYEWLGRTWLWTKDMVS